MRSFLALTLAATTAPQSEAFVGPASFLNSRKEYATSHRLFASKSSYDHDDFHSSENLDESGLSGWLQGHGSRRRQRQEPMNQLRQERLEREQDRESRFVTGDDLQHLRQQVLDLRNELETAPMSRKIELEQTILQAQQMDAEFIYQVATERAEAAEQAGLHEEASRYRREAEHARAALPQFNLEGLWVGKYGEHGFEIINCTYQGDTLIATKVTGDQNVPRGEESFQVDLSPMGMEAGMGMDSGFSGLESLTGGIENDGELFDNGLEFDGTPQQPLEPIELTQEAAEQWGSRFLQRFQGMGQVASAGFRNAQWMEGQLILVGTSYFSFAWLPIGHQVFFGRPSAEMTLKLLRETETEEEHDVPLARQREYLMRCWEETELLDDDMEVSDTLFVSHDQQDYYTMEGCFE